MIMQRLHLQHLPLFLLVILLAACGGDPVSYAFGPTVWIDVPVEELALEAPQPIQIEGHANAPEGIAYVEIWVNGELVEAVDPLSVEGDLARYAYTWTPPGNGEYTIQAMAFANDGEGSSPDSTRVLIGGPTPVPDGPTATLLPSATLVPSHTPPPDEDPPTEIPSTPTFTPPPGAVVQFWAEPQQIQAGACTDIYWHVENVQSVVFGNIEQPFDGSYSDCLCGPQSYTLTITHLDGTEEKQRVDIGVTGECITPTPTPTITPTVPPPDTQAPPAPAPSKPVNGVNLSCVSSTTVMWNAVSDASGIAQYQVEVQRHAGDNNWQAASGSPLTGIGDTNTSVSTECGWTYRWRVRAVDGAGNTGSWSEWFQFNIPLS